MILKNGIEINEKKANRLMQKIIVEENKNLKNKELSDIRMKKKIKKMIEEEINCY